MEKYPKEYAANNGSPKSMTDNPCRVCGWNNDKGIHDADGKKLTEGGIPYHKFEPPITDKRV